MKKRIHLDHHGQDIGLQKAWLEVKGKEMPERERRKYAQVPSGMIVQIGLNGASDPVLWVNVGRSKNTCKQAWADLWPLLDDTIINWEIIEHD